MKSDWTEAKLQEVERELTLARERVSALSDMIDDDKLHGYAVLALSTRRAGYLGKIRRLEERAQRLAEELVDDMIADEAERRARDWL